MITCEDIFKCDDVGELRRLTFGHYEENCQDFSLKNKKYLIVYTQTITISVI
ncbi:MAG: hypothetical protein LBG48_05685 [Rickettsiales bacterium]|jgi:hypothetical protein|nr:hypothetical protein [Rickettsiales bacterium]